MRGTQPVVLPATSTTRVSSVCSPAPVTVAVVVLPLTGTGAPPSILYSTRATPEVASVPCTVTSRKVRFSHAEETVVLSVGRTVSMRTDWIFQDDCGRRRR